MSQEQEKPIEEPEDGPKLYIVDPDDYQKTKKLESIHKARKRVLELRQNKRQDIDVYNGFTGEWYDTFHMELAEAVATYGNEMLPIIEEAIENEILDEEAMQPDGFDVDIVKFIVFCGRIPDHETEDMDVPKPIKTLSVYRQLDRIMRKLGMGLDFEEDKGPAQI